MPLNALAENYALLGTSRVINQIGLHCADPGRGFVPNPGEPTIGVGFGALGIAYFRQPHFLPLMGWAGSGEQARNVFPVTWSVPPGTYLYVTFWNHIPSYSGLTYSGAPEPPDTYLGFAALASSLFNIATVATDGTITSPRHGLHNGDQVRLDATASGPLPTPFTSGPLYSVAGVTTDTFQLLTNAAQTITIQGSPTGGTFTLTYSGQTTVAIPYTSELPEIQPPLEALSNIGAGNVLVSGGPGPDTPWVVAFAGDLAAMSIATMGVTSSITGTAPTVVVEAEGAQTVRIIGSPTGGTFTLTCLSQTTTALPWNATAKAVRLALEALSSVGRRNVTVTGGPGPDAAWTVTFVGSLVDTDVPAMTFTTDFTGGASPGVGVVTTTTGGVTVEPHESGVVFWQEVAPVTFSGQSAITFSAATIILSSASL